ASARRDPAVGPLRRGREEDGPAARARAGRAGRGGGSAGAGPGVTGGDMSYDAKAAPRETTIDLREKGAARDGVPQTSDRRLFVQFLAFGDCDDTGAVARGLEGAGLAAAVYADLHDPRGIGVGGMGERPDTR